VPGRDMPGSDAGLDGVYGSLGCPREAVHEVLLGYSNVLLGVGDGQGDTVEIFRCLCRRTTSATSYPSLSVSRETFMQYVGPGDQSMALRADRLTLEWPRWLAGGPQSTCPVQLESESAPDRATGSALLWPLLRRK